MACYHVDSACHLEPKAMSSPSAGVIKPTQTSVQAHTQRVCEITRADLPVSCPLPGEELWNAHPKVYLPIVEEGGQSVCPYCGARYLLRD